MRSSTLVDSHEHWITPYCACGERSRAVSIIIEVDPIDDARVRCVAVDRKNAVAKGVQTSFVDGVWYTAWKCRCGKRHAYSSDALRELLNETLARADNCMILGR